MSINLSTRCQTMKKEGVFRRNERRQYEGTARLISVKSRYRKGLNPCGTFIMKILVI